jgi:hypothetical protein
VAVDDTSKDATSSLAYKAKTQTYTYTWPTSRAWLGTCLSFVLILDDGNSHTALFQLTH